MMWLLYTIPFGLNTFILLPPIRRFLINKFARYRPIQFFAPGFADPSIEESIYVSERLFHSISSICVSVIFALIFLTSAAFNIFTLLSAFFLAALPIAFYSALGINTESLSNLSRLRRLYSVLTTTLLIAAFVAVICLLSAPILFLSLPSLILTSLGNLGLLTALMIDLLILKVRGKFNINAKQIIGGDTLLMSAAHAKDMKTAFHLISKGADFKDYRYLNGNTILMEAVTQGNIKTVEAILKRVKKLDPKEQEIYLQAANYQNKTAFHLAFNAVKALLARMEKFDSTEQQLYFQEPNYQTDFQLISQTNQVKILNLWLKYQLLDLYPDFPKVGAYRPYYLTPPCIKLERLSSVEEPNSLEHLPLFKKYIKNTGHVIATATQLPADLADCIASYLTDNQDALKELTAGIKEGSARPSGGSPK